MGNSVDYSEQGSLYLNISRGRRDHLKLHRYVGWDCGVQGVDDYNVGGYNADGYNVGGYDADGYNVQTEHSRLQTILAQNSTHQDTSKHGLDRNELKYQDSDTVRTKEILRQNQLEIHQQERENSVEKSKRLNIKKSLSKTLSS